MVQVTPILFFHFYSTCRITVTHRGSSFLLNTWRNGSVRCSRFTVECLSNKYIITDFCLGCCKVKCPSALCSITVNPRKITKRRRPSGSLSVKVSVDLLLVVACKPSDLAVKLKRSCDFLFFFILCSSRDPEEWERSPTGWRKLWGSY